MSIMLVTIMCSYIDCTGDEGHDSFQSWEDGRDGFACGILALLMARYKFEERCGVGARVISAEVSIEQCEEEEWTPGQPPGVHLADAWAEPGGGLAW